MLRLIGKEEDVEVGLQYFGKRFLNPLSGRWVSADPLAVHAPGEADLNVYAYVSGAVLDAVDPLGLCSTKECGRVAGRAAYIGSHVAGAPSEAPSGGYGEGSNEFLSARPGGIPAPWEMRVLAAASSSRLACDEDATAFAQGAKLVTTLPHEGVHREQHLRGQLSASFKDGLEPQEAANEWQAFEAERELADAIGLSEGERAEVGRAIGGYVDDRGDVVPGVKEIAGGETWRLALGLVVESARRNLRDE